MSDKLREALTRFKQKWGGIIEEHTGDTDLADQFDRELAAALTEAPAVTPSEPCGCTHNEIDSQGRRVLRICEDHALYGKGLPVSSQPTSSWTARHLEGFFAATKFIQSNGYSDWDGSANGQTITLTGMANMMADFAEQIRTAEKERCAKLEAQNALLLEALRAVEWKADNCDYNSYCPCCDSVKCDGHTPTCIVGRALEGK